jgi:uncharacterized membrane protein
MTGDRNSPSRLLYLDALRGLLIVLMALDHANHFVAQHHSSGELWGGPFPTYQTALPFLVRLATHLCAPGFFLLMGCGMTLFARARQRQGWRQRAIVGHLMLRGGILIALKLLVVNRAWELSPGGWGPEVYIGVLFALGSTMALGSLLLWSPPSVLLALTTALLVGTDLLTPPAAAWGAPFSPLVRLLLIPGGDARLWVNYPALPWLAPTVFGIWLGQQLSDDAEPAQAARKPPLLKRAPVLGAAFLLAFVCLRAANGFGNIRPWEGDTWIAFLNVVKYPPSITFVLLTTGVNLLMMGLFVTVERKQPQWLTPLSIFGQVPLFFYVTHLFLYAGLGRWLTPNGSAIPQMIPYWLLGLLILYPLCLGYRRLRRHQATRAVLRFL